ncbi:MAG: DUF2339 domain-containing protein [Phycisphaeraceae bacterium]|nr:DUF2339 domain-containing protein [Phycisphaeraceae bacterium]
MVESLVLIAVLCVIAGPILGIISLVMVIMERGHRRRLSESLEGLEWQVREMRRAAAAPGARSFDVAPVTTARPADVARARPSSERAAEAKPPSAAAPPEVTPPPESASPTETGQEVVGQPGESESKAHGQAKPTDAASADHPETVPDRLAMDDTTVEPVENLRLDEGESDSATSTDDRAGHLPDSETDEPIEPAGIKSRPARSEVSSTKGRSELVEKTVGTRLLVWVGGVALALAGAFLLKFTWDHALLSLEARHWLAAVMGVGLIGAGVFVRERAANVAAALVGAGLVDLYLVLFAATSQFNLLSPGLGFVLLILVSALAVALSIWHGQFAALMGWAGGFLTPLMVGGRIESPGVLFGYLLLLQLVLLIVSEQRRFHLLAPLSAMAMIGWAIGYPLFEPEAARKAADLWANGYLLIGGALFVLQHLWVRHFGDGEERPIWFDPCVIALISLSIMFLAGFAYAVHHDLAMGRMVLLFIFAGAVLLLGAWRPTFQGFGLLPALMIPVLLAMFSGTVESGHFRTLVGGFGLLYGLGAMLCTFHPSRGMFYAVMAALAVPVYFLIGGPMSGAGVAWGGEALGPNGWWLPAACGLAMGVVVLLHARGMLQDARQDVAGVLGLGMAGMLTWSVGLALVDHWAWLIVVGALLAVAITLMAEALRLMTYLRWAVVWIAGGVAIVLLMAWVDAPWDARWISLLVFGAAAALMAVAAWRINGQGQRGLAAGLVSMAAITPILGAVLVARQSLVGADVGTWPRGLMDPGIYSAVCLAGALVLLQVAKRIEFPGLTAVAVVVKTLAILVAVLSLGIGFNPLIVGVEYPDGWSMAPLAQPLLAHYGPVVALLALMGLAWTHPKLRASMSDSLNPVLDFLASPRSGQVVTIVFLALTGVLLVRDFHAPGAIAWFGDAPVGAAEASAYGLIMLMIGLALLECRRRYGGERVWPGGSVMLGLAAACWFLGPVFFANPLIFAGAGASGPIVGMLAGGEDAAWSAWLTACWVYGLPIGAAVLVAQRYRVETDLFDLSGVGRVMVMACSGLLALVMVRLAFVGPTVELANTPSMREWTVMGLAMGMLGLAALEMVRARRWKEPGLGGLIYLGLAILFWAIGPMIGANPLWTDQLIGGLPMLNDLLWLYGLPAVILGLAAWRYGAMVANDTIRHALPVLSLVLVFILVSLQVRHGFNRPELWLTGERTGEAEWYTYSAAWLGLGMVLFAAGLVFRTAALRVGSLVVMLLAVGKVFILDAAQLDGLWRVASFFGLGITLVGMGYVYQRFIFAPPRLEASADDAPSG